MELNREDDTSLTLAQHAQECITEFHKYLAAPRMRKKLKTMEYAKTNFVRWTLVMEVFGPPEVSLEYQLRDSPATVEKIHQLFHVILHALTLRPVSAHTLQSEGPPTTKKRRLSESGRAEVDREFDNPSKSNIGPDEGEINLTQIVFTVGGSVIHLWRLFHNVHMSPDLAEHTRKKFAELYLVSLFSFSKRTKFKSPPAQSILYPGIY